MTKSEFLQTIGADEAAKELRGFTTKMFVMNAFVVELQVIRNRYYTTKNKEMVYLSLFKLIDKQVDGMAYDSSEITDMSFYLSIFSDLIENIETSGI